MDIKTEKMTQDEYFEWSEGRLVVTPENVGGLIEYPAMFHAMQQDRELRPALSEAQSTGRAMNDFLSMTPEDFLAKYVVADGPTNPKTGKPYGTDTKAFIEWKAMQTKTPVSTAQFNMFGKMALAYNTHSFIKPLSKLKRIRNAVFRADISGTPCMVKVDSLYTGPDVAFAIDVKTTSDMNTFARAARGLYYPEQQALISLVLRANGITQPQVRIVALEKGPMPRCGVFAVKDQKDTEESLNVLLAQYANDCALGTFSTRFEAQVLI